MKNLKLSFALIVAVLAIGATVAANANIFGKRAITRCFTQISVKNAAGTITHTLDATIATPRACTQTELDVANAPYVTAAVTATSLANESTCTVDDVFCCAKVTEIPVGSPEYANAPFIDLGEGLRKYKINSPADVFCKVQL